MTEMAAKDNAVVNLKEINYNIYLDKYGYAVGVKEVERVSNYVFITGVLGHGDQEGVAVLHRGDGGEVLDLQREAPSWTAPWRL